MLPLETKPDLGEAVARFEAWWRGEILDRPPVTIRVRGEPGPRRPAKHYDSVRERWFDFDAAIGDLEERMSRGIFLAETLPLFMPNLGPEICATLFGAELKFSADTSWSVPCLKDIRAVLDLEPDLRNPYWQAIVELTERSLDRGAGRWITGVTDLHTNGDLVAALRDPQEFALDCMDDPEGVRLACEHVTAFFPPLFHDLWKRIESRGQPCTTWLPIAHDGPWYVPSCDVSAILSPALFNELILPSLREERTILDRGIYHLDGPDALVHLDALLAWRELDAVQWVYGAGAGPASRWTDVYRRIQEAGKSIQLLAEDLDDCKAVAQHLHPAGVWFCPGGAYPRAEAEDFLAWAEHWAKRGR